MVCTVPDLNVTGAESSLRPRPTFREQVGKVSGARDLSLDEHTIYCGF